ncbi:MAG: GNAT family N-acetyltransferase [Burkholderiales bacterium]|nr:GNAT family N-acetyltransferase [Burkholderiales bacterium]
MPNVTLSSHDDWPDAAAVVDQGLDTSNDLAAPLHEVRRLACLAWDASGQLVGGALGRRWGRACELQVLWVRQQDRRAGLGRRLVGAFEQLARDRGCRSVYLETFNFQAPGLYQALGYATQYLRDDFPDGIVKHHMLKRLVPGRDAGPVA